MQMTIDLPDDLGQQVRDMSDPQRFVTETLRAALQERQVGESNPEASRWAKIARRIAEDPNHLEGYSEQLNRDAQEVREGFALGSDVESE